MLMASLFGSTYLCEQFFSNMKHTKNRYRVSITDQHLAQQLTVTVSSTKADIDRKDSAGETISSVSLTVIKICITFVHVYSFNAEI